MAEATPSSSAELPVIQAQEYRVKLGKSFTFPKENSFHTMKYDFKPQSVDSTKPGRLKVAEDEVNVSLPVVQAETVEDVAQFRGPKKSCLKECILIIDTHTGEAILEKISNTVQLKVIRKPRDRSVSPSPFAAHMTSKPQAVKSQLAVSSTSHNPSPTLGKPASRKAKKPKPTQPKPRMKAASVVKSETVASSSPKTTTTTTSVTATNKMSTNSLPKQPRKKRSQKVSNSKTNANSAMANNIPTITESFVPSLLNSTGSNYSSTSNNHSLPSNSVSANLMPASSMVGASMPLIGMELGHEQLSEISPIPSSNPTPEPKRQKVGIDNSSSSSDDSSSSSSGSDSDSDDSNMATNTVPPYPSSHVTSNPGHMTSHMMPASHQQQQQQPQGKSSHNVQPPQSMPVLHQDQKTVPRPIQQPPQSIGGRGGHVTHMPQIYPGHVPQQRNPIGQSSSSSSGSDSESSSGSSSSDESSDSSSQANNEVAMYSAVGQAPSKAHSRQKSIDLGRDLELSDSDSDL